MNDYLKAKQIKAEIVALHQFFQDWFNGDLPNTDAAFARFAHAMADDFRMVTPDGRLVESKSLLDGLRNAHGQRCGIRIWIENAQVHMNQNGLWLATYEEWQAVDGSTRGRISTALFAEDADAPDGVRWLHVHETFF